MDSLKSARRDTTEAGPTKKAKSAPANGLGFGFNEEAFSDHKIEVSIRDDPKSKRTVFVSKLVIAAHSAVLKKKIMAGGTTTEVILEPGKSIDLFVDLLRWMYTGTLDIQKSDLAELISLAQQFQAKKALEACTQGLHEAMSTATACHFLEKEDTAEAASLYEQSKLYLQATFRELNLETFLSPDFANLTHLGLKVVLESELLHIGTENVVFAALQSWVHRDFEARKVHMASLLDCVRFQHVQKNYLLDVVRTEAELDYSQEAKKAFAKKIIEAYVHHCSSADRLKALTSPPELPSCREFDETLLQETFEWKIPIDPREKEVWSNGFFLGGYYLYLLMQRKNPTGPKGGTVGLYIHVKVKDSGLGQDFFIPLAFELLVKNKITGQYFSSKGAYSSPFSWSNRAWGYVDILGIPWDELLKPDCPYNDSGTLQVKALVWFQDYWNKLNAKKEQEKLLTQ